MGSDSWLGAEIGVYFSTFFVCNSLLSLKVQYHMFSLEKWRIRYWKKKNQPMWEKKRHFIVQMICTEYLHKIYMHSSAEAKSKIYIGPLAGGTRHV